MAVGAEMRHFSFLFYYGTQLFPINRLSYRKVQITYTKKRLGFYVHRTYESNNCTTIHFFKNSRQIQLYTRWAEPFHVSNGVNLSMRRGASWKERPENWLWIDREATTCLPSKFCRNAQIPTSQWKVTRNCGGPFSTENVAFSTLKLAKLEICLASPLVLLSLST